MLDFDHSESRRDFEYCRGLKFEEVIRKMIRAIEPGGIFVERGKEYLE